jgi:hypothetical protein
VLRKVISANSSGMRINNKPCIGPFVIDNNISFVCSGYAYGFRAVFIDKIGQVSGGGIDIVNDGLVG